MQQDQSGLRNLSCSSHEDVSDTDSVSTTASDHHFLEKHDHSVGAGIKTKTHVLLLDLDETLIRAFNENPKIPSYGDTKRVTYNDVEGKLHISYVIARPHLREFLQETSQHYRIFIYTAGLLHYAQAIVETLDISQYIEGIYFRDHCTSTSETYHQKNIFNFGFDQEKLVFVDDWEKQTTHAPENSITIKIFNGKKIDEELIALKGFLSELSKQMDVRSVSKRYSDFNQSRCASSHAHFERRLNKQSILDLIRSGQPREVEEVAC